MTLFDHMRQRLLDRAGLGTPKKTLKFEDLAKSEWSTEFENYMRNRLIMGALRYGLLGAAGKPNFDRMASIHKRAKKYAETGNQELLVDIANIALVEFVDGSHPNKHFSADDDGEHVTVKK